MKIRPVGAEFIHADRQIDTHDESMSLFAILRSRLKRRLLLVNIKERVNL